MARRNLLFVVLLVVMLATAVMAQDFAALNAKFADDAVEAASDAAAAVAPEFLAEGDIFAEAEAEVYAEADVEATAEAESELTTRCVTASALNVRSGPGTNYKVVKTIKKGARVSVSGTSGGFSKIATGQYVSSQYLGACTGSGSTPSKPAKPSTPSSSGSSTGKINQRGLDLIKSFEGWYSCKYRDPIGLWTIGYGHLIKSGESFNHCLSKTEGENLLRRDVSSFEGCVRSRVKVPLNSNQFSALVSFSFNVGCGNLSSSTLLRELNAKNYGAVCGQLARWNKAGGKTLPGLTRRRQEECNLFKA